MNDTIAILALQREVEDFLYKEADLIDERQYGDWLELCTDDIRYWMPLVRNVQYGQKGQEYTREQMDVAWIDEGKETLTQRVKQLATGIHWAEEPQSRTSHAVTNVRMVEIKPDVPNASEVTVRCRFIVYRNRLHIDEDLFVGKRIDTLRKVDGQWMLSRREMHLDQNVLLAKNLPGIF